MKKRTKLLGILLMAGFIFLPLSNASSSKNEPMIVLAEEDSSTEFEEVTYTYIGINGNGSITITLISETECRITLIIDEVIEAEEILTYTIEGDILTVYEDDEWLQFKIDGTTLEPYDYSGREEDEETENKGVFDELLDELKEYKETYLDPLLGGLTLSTIISVCMTILLAIYNKKINAKHKKDVEEYYDNLKNNMNKIDEVLEMARKQNEISNMVINSFSNSVKQIEEQLSKLYSETEKIEYMKNALIGVSKIVSIQASSSKEAIRMGVSEEINQLKAEIEKIK